MRERSPETVPSPVMKDTMAVTEVAKEAGKRIGKEEGGTDHHREAETGAANGPRHRPLPRGIVKETGPGTGTGTGTGAEPGTGHLLGVVSTGAAAPLVAALPHPLLHHPLHPATAARAAAAHFPREVTMVGTGRHRVEVVGTGTGAVHPFHRAGIHHAGLHHADLHLLLVEAVPPHLLLVGGPEVPRGGRRPHHMVARHRETVLMTVV